MRKLAFALVCLVSVAFFASCDPTVVDNPEPSISIITGADYVTGTLENPQIISNSIEDETDWRYGFHVESNAQTKKELSSLKVTWEWTANGIAQAVDSVIDLTGKTSYDFVDYVFSSKAIIQETVVRATVTDVDNQSKSAVIAYNIDQPATTLPIYSIDWQRKGSNLLNNTQDDMSAYGLQWLSRDIYHANIRPLPGYSLYVINNDAETFNNIVTDIDLANFFANLQENNIQPVAEYRNISVAITGDKVYNDVLATIDNEGYMSLVLIEKANVQTGNFGVWTTITGRGK